MSSSHYRLTLVTGPQLLYVPGEWDEGPPGVTAGEEIAVTGQAHQYLYSAVLAAPKATLLDLLRLSLRDPRLVPIFLHYGSARTCNRIGALDLAELTPSPELQHIRIFMDGRPRLAAVAHPDAKGSCALFELEEISLPELLPLPLEMSMRPGPPHPLTKAPAGYDEPDCPDLGELLLAAFAGVRDHRS